MMRTSLRTCAAISAAGVAIVGALTVTVAPTASADNTWGAIVRDEFGATWGMSYAQPTKATAISAAGKACGKKTCTVTLRTFNDCGALFHGNGQYSNQLYAGTGPTQEAAESDAQANGRPDGTLVSSACNAGHSPGTNNGA